MTTPHEHDRSLEQWLSASLPATSAPTDACLDTETAAAWVDGGLDRSVQQQAETHLSTCARCQALVGAIVTIETADAAAAEPVPARWRGWLNWMVPLGALATAGLALVVWLNVPAQPVRRADEALQARLEPAPGTSEPPPSAKVAGEASPPEVARRASAEDATANVAAPASPAPEAATALAAPPEAVSDQAVAGRAAAVVDVTSPDGQVRWRLAGRVVLRSIDRGATWTTVVVDAPGRIQAGTAPSSTVCWLVGERGLVLRTDDGVAFRRVAAPATGDLSSLTASSATAAVVSATDGRRFATTDGGNSWELMR